MPSRKEKENFDLRVDVIRYYAKHAPKNREELERFAKAINGAPWLTSRLCNRHSSVFDFVAGVYFTKAAEVLGVGNRGGFKTASVSLCNAMEMLSRPGIKIAHASAEKEQAKRAQAWTERFLCSDAVKASGLTEGAEFLKQSAHLKSGSSLEIITASIGGFNAVHPNRLRIDEFDLIKPNVIEEGRMIPKSFNGFDRGITFISSRKKKNGNVDQLLYARKNRAVEKYVWCIAEVIEACPESRHGEKQITTHVEDLTNPEAPPILVRVYENCPECPLITDCKGQFAHAKGITTIGDAIDEFTTIDSSVWLSQIRSRKVSNKSGKMFPKFRANNIRDRTPVEGQPILIIVDFGGGGEGRTAVLYAQIIAGDVQVYAEYVTDSMQPENDAKMAEQVLDNLFPGFPCHDECAGDCAVPQTISKWNEHTVRFKLRPVKKLTREGMFDRLCALVAPNAGPPRFFVHSRCVNLIDEMSKLRSRTQDKGVDTVDAALYLGLKVEGDLKKTPGVCVVQPGGKGVVKSEEPEHERTKRVVEENFTLGAHFDRIMRKIRRRR